MLKEVDLKGITVEEAENLQALCPTMLDDYVKSVWEYTDKELEEKISSSDEWDMDLLKELCRRAGMEDEWDAADGDTFEEVALEAAGRLGVEIM